MLLIAQWLTPSLTSFINAFCAPLGQPYSHTPLSSPKACWLKHTEGGGVDTTFSQQQSNVFLRWVCSMIYSSTQSRVSKMKITSTGSVQIRLTLRSLLLQSAYSYASPGQPSQCQICSQPPKTSLMKVIDDFCWAGGYLFTATVTEAEVTF